MVTLLKTGNSEIDEQHAIIQDCLSDLAILLDGPCDDVILRNSLEALHSYADWHFTFEERLLKRAKYPKLIEHVAEHRAIIGQLNTLRRKLTSGNFDVKPLIPMVCHWIADHVNNEDILAVNHFAEIEPIAIHRDQQRLESSLPF